MKSSKALIYLSWLTALLAAISTCASLFWQPASHPFAFTTLHGQSVQINGGGIYYYDTLFAAAGARGTDAVTLFLAIPLLLIAIQLYRRGSLRGGLFLVSVLAYFLYVAGTMAFSTAYNNLVLIYIATFSASLYAFVLACAAVDIPALASHAAPGLPHGGMAAFLFIAGGATAFIWLSDMIPAMAQGSVPAVLASYTTIYTYAFDIAVITPTAILAGVLLLRRAALGYLLAPILTILCTFVGLTVISQTIFQLNAGITFSPGQFAGLIGSWVVMAGFAIVLVIAFFRHFAIKGSPKTILSPVDA